MPEILIVSTQRSGTHLLQSFLENHSQINGNGELFLRLQRTGEFKRNVEGKYNIGILMYNQIYIFKRLGGKLGNHKIIHLLRNPYDVALSRVKLDASRLQFGINHRAHFYDTDSPSDIDKVRLSTLSIEASKVDDKIESIHAEQQRYKRLLSFVPHLELHYEEFAPKNKNIKILNNMVKNKLSNYLNLDLGRDDLVTTYIKI